MLRINFASLGLRDILLCSEEKYRFFWLELDSA
jgi:hypothetical protein